MAPLNVDAAGVSGSAPSVEPIPLAVSATVNSKETPFLGTVWSSLIAPIKKFWDPPPIHLSTYYGRSNQPGRPGPVLAVMVEKGTPGRHRQRQRQRRQQQQKHEQRISSTASAHPLAVALHPVGSRHPDGSLDVLGSDNSNADSLSGSSVSHYSTPAQQPGGVSGRSTRSASHGQFGVLSSSASQRTPSVTNSSPPEIDGVLVITPRAIERYQLSGLPLKRAALPDTITSCFQTRIAGVGRVLVCGSQTGRVYVLKTDMLFTILVFDAGCIDSEFLCATGHMDAIATHLNLRSATKLGKDGSCQLTVTAYKRPHELSSPSIFANPPLLLAHAAAATAPSSEYPRMLNGGSDMASGQSEGSHAVLSDQGSAAGPVGVSANNPGLPGRVTGDLLHSFGTMTGDGITPALLEAQSIILQGNDVLPTINFRSVSGVGLALPSSGSCSEAGTADPSLNGRSPPHPPLSVASTPSSRSRVLNDTISQLEMVRKAGATLRDGSVPVLDSRLPFSLPPEITTIGISCFFANFCEIVFAGTSYGTVFGWEVPSGKLLYIFELSQLRHVAHIVTKDTSADTSAPTAGKAYPTSLCAMSDNAYKTGRYVAALLAVHVEGLRRQLWAGYGNGIVAIYDLEAGRCIQVLHHGAAVRSLELVPSLAIVLVLSGNDSLVAWDCRNFSYIRTFDTQELTQNVTITCLRVMDCEQRVAGAPSAIVFLGCIDGSISVQQISWGDPSADARNHNRSRLLRNKLHGSKQAIPLEKRLFLNSDSFNAFPLDNSLAATSATPLNSIEKASVVYSASQKADIGAAPAKTLSCTLLRAFIRDSEPRCPISSLWVDVPLDTLFVGDASGIVATLLPIRYLLGGYTGGPGTTTLIGDQKIPNTAGASESNASFD